MIPSEFNFAKFIHIIEDEDYIDILRIAEREATVAENAARTKGYGQSYVNAVKGFLFFMREGIKPDGVEDEDFQMFRCVCEKLIAKKQFKPSVLKLFE